MPCSVIIFLRPARLRSSTCAIFEIFTKNPISLDFRACMPNGYFTSEAFEFTRIRFRGYFRVQKFNTFFFFDVHLRFSISKQDQLFASFPIVPNRYIIHTVRSLSRRRLTNLWHPDAIPPAFMLNPTRFTISPFPSSPSTFESRQTARVE